MEEWLNFICYNTNNTFAHNFRSWDNTHDTTLSENLTHTLCSLIDGKQQKEIFITIWSGGIGMVILFLLFSILKAHIVISDLKK